MTLPRTVADVLSDHVVFEIESIDRMYLNLYQPRLQYGGGIAGFFVGHRGHRFASSALMAPITQAFVADIHHYIAAHGLDLVHFRKGQRKDDLTRRYLARAQTGRCPSRCCMWAGRRRRTPCSAPSSGPTR